jgi:hypothetical protein
MYSSKLERISTTRDVRNSIASIPWKSENYLKLVLIPWYFDTWDLWPVWCWEERSCQSIPQNGDDNQQDPDEEADQPQVSLSRGHHHHHHELCRKLTSHFLCLKFLITFIPIRNPARLPPMWAEYPTLPPLDSEYLKLKVLFHRYL